MFSHEWNFALFWRNSEKKAKDSLTFQQKFNFFFKLNFVNIVAISYVLAGSFDQGFIYFTKMTQ